jgi:hypothetical protein
MTPSHAHSCSAVCPYNGGAVGLATDRLYSSGLGWCPLSSDIGLREERPPHCRNQGFARGFRRRRGRAESASACGHKRSLRDCFSWLHEVRSVVTARKGFCVHCSSE